MLLGEVVRSLFNNSDGGGGIVGAKTAIWRKPVPRCLERVWRIDPRLRPLSPADNAVRCQRYVSSQLTDAARERERTV